MFFGTIPVFPFHGENYKEHNLCVKFSINHKASGVCGTNTGLIKFTATRGPGPPHYRSFTITARYTTLGRTPLEE